MKHLILALAATLLILPASAETLKTGPVIKESRKVCVAGLKAEGFKAAGKLCECFAGKLKGWADAEEGHEQQLRLWSIKSDALPQDMSDEEFYRRVGEAGISRNEIDAAMMLNFYEIQDFIEACAEPYR